MKTIEERAKEYAQKAFPYSPYYFEATRKEYIKIMTEQRDIDIDKAKNAFGKSCGWLSTFPWYNEVFEEFIKNMEE